MRGILPAVPRAARCSRFAASNICSVFCCLAMTAHADRSRGRNGGMPMDMIQQLHNAGQPLLTLTPLKTVVPTH
eukprot:114719-Rhodomonas_salina.1